MEIESVVGSWTLVGSTSINGEIAFLGQEPDSNGASDWLNGLGEEVEGSIKSVSGLELEISREGRFSECLSGQAEVYWFDVELFLSNVAPFHRALASIDKFIYFQPDGMPSWLVDVQSRYGNAILRYDDGVNFRH